MLVPRLLPESYADWNRRHHAPFGRRGRRLLIRAGVASTPLALRYCTPYAWQPNNTTRRFEYPWAFEQIQRIGRPVRVLDIGAGMAGFQFTLSQQGHEVHAVDPGMGAKGKGWELNPAFHARLARAYHAPVKLWPTTISGAQLEDQSFDVVLSVSTIEHLTTTEVDELAVEVRRVLKPDGLLVLTVDLFLDVQPFTLRTANVYGRNVDIRALLEAFNSTLVSGVPEELFGFAAFDPDRIQSNLSDYMIGEYPGLSQCVTAAPRT